MEIIRTAVAHSRKRRPMFPAVSALRVGHFQQEAGRCSGERTSRQRSKENELSTVQGAAASWGSSKPGEL
jgi:hypothetical protein